MQFSSPQLDASELIEQSENNDLKKMIKERQILFRTNEKSNHFNPKYRFMNLYFDHGSGDRSVVRVGDEDMKYFDLELVSEPLTSGKCHRCRNLKIM